MLPHWNRPKIRNNYSIAAWRHELSPKANSVSHDAFSEVQVTGRANADYPQAHDALDAEVSVEGSYFHESTPATRARSLQDPRFPAVVARLLARQDIAPGDLTLEITESTIMADPIRAMTVLTELHALGVHLSIDDFGTGYSSLGYLKSLPMDEVKIDKSFVLGMGTGDQKDEAIVRSVVAMAHAMGITVVAEGGGRRGDLCLTATPGVRQCPGLLPEPAAARAGAGSLAHNLPVG